MTGIANCSARAASGQVAAAPPRSLMNSRRLITAPAGLDKTSYRQNSTLKGGRDDSQCPLWVDTVEKRFCGPECATLIQNRGRVRNFDSNTLLFGFDCCVWADR